MPWCHRSAGARSEATCGNCQRTGSVAEQLPRGMGDGALGRAVAHAGDVKAEPPPPPQTDQTPSAQPPLPEVTVRAQREAVERRVETFVSRSIRRPFEASLARWNAPICLLGVGLAPDQRELLRVRLSKIASALPPEDTATSPRPHPVQSSRTSSSRRRAILSGTPESPCPRSAPLSDDRQCPLRSTLVDQLASRIARTKGIRKSSQLDAQPAMAVCGDAGALALLVFILTGAVSGISDAAVNPNTMAPIQYHAGASGSLVRRMSQVMTN
jgi:hypothetical protein